MNKPRNTDGPRKASNKAGILRQLVWTMLSKKRGKVKKMSVSQLKKALEDTLSIPLRSDNLIGTLVSDERFELRKDRSSLMIVLVTEEMREEKRQKAIASGSTAERMGLDKEHKKLSVREFIERALDTLSSNPAKYPGQIHTVFSGFNKYFREYFPGADPVVETKKLEDEKFLTIKIAKGGAFISRATPPSEPTELAASG